MFIFLLFLAVAFFCFEKKCLAENNALAITEIMYSPTENEAGEKVEWLELYANADKNFILGSNKQLKNFYFCTKKGSSDSSCADSSHIFATYAIDSSLDIKKGDFIIATKNPDAFKNIPDVKIIKTSSSFNLLSDENAFIAYSEDNKTTWKEPLKYAEFFSKKVAGFSLERIDFNKDNSNSNWQESFCLGGSLGKGSTQQKDCPKIEPLPPIKPTSSTYTGKIKINEILPAPKTKNEEKEFVELKNISDEKIDLFGMWIEDEKNHKVYFPDEKIDPGKLYFLEGNFELNNTTPDTAFLVAKNGTKEKPIDSVRYEKPKYDYAYAWNGSAWQWTSKITKGTENEFDEILSGKIKKDKTIYAGIYANFEVRADAKAEHFTWDFGDSHKSYLKKTRHKYEKAGTYDATLKIAGEGEDNLLSFTVAVEKYGKAKVRIVSLSPNPKGRDSENEWIEIFNSTEKKINLKNWSVATGAKNLYNHPITKNFIFKAGEQKKLTRDFCAFSLGNKQAKIELRYPNGKVADKVRYDHGNSILEDELYQKEDNIWQWTGGTQKTPKENQTDTEAETPTEPEIILADSAPKNETDESKKENVDFDLSALGKYSENPTWSAKQKTQTILLFANSNINPKKFLAKNQGQVLGILTVKYPQTAMPSKNSRQALFSLKYFWKIINQKINSFLNKS